MALIAVLEFGDNNIKRYSKLRLMLWLLARKTWSSLSGLPVKAFVMDVF